MGSSIHLEAFRGDLRKGVVVEAPFRCWVRGLGRGEAETETEADLDDVGESVRLRFVGGRERSLSEKRSSSWGAESGRESSDRPNGDSASGA